MGVEEEQIIVGDEDGGVGADEVEVQDEAVATDVDAHGYVDADDDASLFAVRSLQEAVQQNLLLTQAHLQMMPEIYCQVHVLINRQKDLKIKLKKMINHISLYEYILTLYRK